LHLKWGEGLAFCGRDGRSRGKRGEEREVGKGKKGGKGREYFRGDLLHSF